MDNDQKQTETSKTVFAPPVAPDGTIHTLHSCIDVNDPVTFKQLVENGSDVNYIRKGDRFLLYLVLLSLVTSVRMNSLYLLAYAFSVPTLDFLLVSMKIPKCWKIMFDQNSESSKRNTSILKRSNEVKNSWCI